MKYQLILDEGLKDLYVNMVRKVYPDFNPDVQYCFWIVPDFWDDKLLWVVDGHVSVLDKDNHFVDLGLPSKVKQVTRTPYCNKGIRQIGVQNGRCRCFGIPLVFDSLEDLQKIKCVKIHWDIVKPMFLSADDSKPLDVRLTTLDVVYYLDFDVTNVQDGHWFTLSYQDKFFDSAEEFRQEIHERYDEAMCACNFYVEKGLSDDVSVDDSMVDIYTSLNEFCNLSDRQLEIVDYFTTMDVKHLFALAEEHNKRCRVVSTDACELDRYYYEVAVRLQADPYPDFVPSCEFGFK